MSGRCQTTSARVTRTAASSNRQLLRMAFLDAAGILPTPAEVETFLADTRPDKRARLIEEILGRSEYVDYWAHE